MAAHLQAGRALSEVQRSSALAHSQVMSGPQRMQYSKEERASNVDRLPPMCVFGIQHAQIVLPMIHMDFIPRITQKLGDIVFLFIMKF